MLPPFKINLFLPEYILYGELYSIAYCITVLFEEHFILPPTGPRSGNCPTILRGTVLYSSSFPLPFKELQDPAEFSLFCLSLPPVNDWQYSWSEVLTFL